MFSGSVYEQNGAIGLKIHLSGFGLSDESKSEFGDLDEVAWLSAKVQGTVVLGVVITGEGKAGTIHVLKAAPFGLTAQAIKAVRNWEFKPAQQRDGTPVSMAVPIEVTYRMF